MNNTLLDNSQKFMMRNVLKNFIASGKYNHICIATGYWDLPGIQVVYDELKNFLEKGGRLDIMIGQEPQLRTYQLDKTVQDTNQFPGFYLQRDINNLSEEYRPAAQLLMKYCTVKKYNADANADCKINLPYETQDESQIQVRIYGQKEPDKKQFLHAKCYIFLGQGEADGIIGSSNFTQKGLEDNAELNYLETHNSVVVAPISEYNDSKSHIVWFEEKWN